MTPLFPTQSGYSSCIKIAGIPILPPLITDERRNQLKEERAKAVEIEKRIKRKRSSIDSGVMTGSYIDNFKCSDNLIPESLTNHNELSISELASSGAIYHKDNSSSESCSGESFLKSALEDAEFREFFYTTAERIFKDNNMQHEDMKCESENAQFVENINQDEKHSYVKNISENSLLTDDQINLTIDDHAEPINRLDLRVSCDSVPSCFTGTSEGCSSKDNVPYGKEPLTPAEPRVRRNSYTLESPSPILLEHMAKRNILSGQNGECWQVPEEKKERGLGFKTFLDAKKQRKTWVKDGNLCIPPKEGNLPNTKVPNCLKEKSKTFVKADDSNYSLPCSSCTSPTNLPTFAYSSHSIQFACKNSLSSNNMELNIRKSSKTNGELKVLQQQQEINNSNKTNILEKNIGSTSGVSTEDVTNNSCVKSYPSYETLTLFPLVHDLPRSNHNREDCVDQSLIHKQTVDFDTVKENRALEITKGQNELDDEISVCSSLSLSKFLPVEDNHESRPSTAEDVSVLLSELQIRHERQIAELLEMQHKEKILLSRLNSNCGSISSHSNANLSISEFSFDHNNSVSGKDLSDKRLSCNRELFPSAGTQRTPPQETQHRTYPRSNSDLEKIAALKLTSCVRGYLTRRLLKTERVQQLIDTIKESLNCAFSLQSETELRKNDLELHERLAHQLTAALYELQTIISAPVATRMSIIATDREKLRKPVSRPASAISLATQKSLLRRQKSLNCSDKKPQESNAIRTQAIRPRTKSLCLVGASGAGANKRNDPPRPCSVSSNSKPWR